MDAFEWRHHASVFRSAGVRNLSKSRVFAQFFDNNYQRVIKGKIIIITILPELYENIDFPIIINLQVFFENTSKFVLCV